MRMTRAVLSSRSGARSIAAREKKIPFFRHGLNGTLTETHRRLFFVNNTHVDGYTCLNIEDYNHKISDPRSQCKNPNAPYYQDIIVPVRHLKEEATTSLHNGDPPMQVLEHLSGNFLSQRPSEGWGRNIRLPVVANIMSDFYAIDPIDPSRCGILWAIKHAIFETDVRQFETLAAFRRRFDENIQTFFREGIQEMEVRGW
jgi:hypothetical protein